MDSWQSIAGFWGVKRAVEIALSGDHSITFVGFLEDGVDVWLKLIPTAIHITPCRCTNAVGPCICTPSQIKQHYQTKHAIHAGSSDILVEVYRRYPYEVTDVVAGETFADVQKRIDAAKLRATPTGLQDMATTLLFRVADKLKLTPAKIVGISNVAKTIAKMDGRDMIDTADIAEAVQYQTLILNRAS